MKYVIYKKIVLDTIGTLMFHLTIDGAEKAKAEFLKLPFKQRVLIRKELIKRIRTRRHIF